MSRYVDPTEQLVTELYVRDVKISSEFYKQFGFEPVRELPDFAGVRVGRPSVHAGGAKGLAACARAPAGQHPSHGPQRRGLLGDRPGDGSARAQANRRQGVWTQGLHHHRPGRVCRALRHPALRPGGRLRCYIKFYRSEESSPFLPMTCPRRVGTGGTTIRKNLPNAFGIATTVIR